MPSKSKTAMAVAAGGCFLLLCCVVVYVLMKNGGGSGGDGLPEVPMQAPGVVFKGVKFPGMSGRRDMTLQDLINEMFKVQSKCWQVKNYFRTTMPRILIKYSTSLDKFMSSAQRWMDTRTYPSAETLRRYRTTAENALNEVQDAVRDLLNCDAAATFEMPWFEGSREVYNVREFALKADSTMTQMLKVLRSAN